MQRVFIEPVGQYKPGDCPDRPAWWWQHHEKVSAPIEKVLKAGLEALARQNRQRKTA